MALPTMVLVCSFAVIRSESTHVSSSLGSRMVFLIHGPQTIECQMRIHLGRRNIRVAEDGLHRAQVSTVLHHMSCARMAQQVWRSAAARSRRCGLHHLPDPLACQFTAASRDEEQRRA